MVTTKEHTEANRQRHLQLHGASNFRDLGGYRTADARQQVRWRRLFRSDRLSELTADDLAIFARLGISHAIDFRGNAERSRNDYQLANCERIAIAIEPSVVQNLQELLHAGQALDAPTAHHLMQDTYCDFVNNDSAQYRRFFEILLNVETPVVFHCTAGKDRTGFASAILLELLGVDRKTALQDYLLTNDYYLHPHMPRVSLPEDVLNVLWRVHADFMHAAYREVEKNWGSMTDYARQQLGVGPEALAALRQRYLEPAQH